jgi:hypothetical protein
MARRRYLRIGFLAIVTTVSAQLAAYAQQPSKELLLQQQAQGWSAGSQLSSQPSKEEALAAMAQGAAGAGQPQFVPGISATSLCFTCGGSWPAFSGAIPLPAGSRPIERGSGCSGILSARPDTIPFLCSQQ